MNVRVKEICDRIKKEYDLITYMEGLGIKLFPAGNNKKKCICEFHDDKNPSLFVEEKDGIFVWHCFGCNVGGTIIDFYVKYHSCSLSTAIKELSAELGIQNDADYNKDDLLSYANSIVEDFGDNYKVSEEEEIEKCLLAISTACRLSFNYVGNNKMESFLQKVDFAAESKNLDFLKKWRQLAMISDFSKEILKVEVNSNKELNLNKLREEKKNCILCGLRQSCKQVVCCTGSSSPDIMFVGEAPGKDEDDMGEPFIGRAGKILRSYLNYFNIDKRISLISNILGCRPANNVFPTDENIIKNCINKWLFQEIQIVQPKYIVLLGRNAAISALEIGNMSLGEARSQKWDILGYPAKVTYHPSFLARNGGENSLDLALKGEMPHIIFFNDIKEVLESIKK